MRIEVAGGEIDSVEGEAEVRGKTLQRLEVVVQKQPSIRDKYFCGEDDHAGAEIPVPLRHRRRLGNAHSVTFALQIGPAKFNTKCR